MALKFHCIGDSHVCLFLGYDHIPKEYPYVAKSLMPHIYCYRLGAGLAYNLNKYGTTTRAREYVEEILAKLDPQKDILLLSFGEVDCRAHLLKQVEKRNVSYETVVNECLANYVSAIHEFSSRGFKIYIWNAVYSANYFVLDNNLEFPYFGSVHDRNRITTLFNKGLQERQQSGGYTFVDVSANLIDAETSLTKEEFYHDSIHLNHKLFGKTIRLINRLNGDTLFGPADFIRYKFRYAVRTSVNTASKTGQRIKRKLKSFLSSGVKMITSH